MFLELDSGNGITHATAGAILISRKILGKLSSPWERVYLPSRLMTDDIMEYVKHNLSVQLQYKDWLTGTSLTHCTLTLALTV